MMKLTTLTIALLPLLLACGKEPAGDKSVSLSVSIDNPALKTLWAASDVISINGVCSEPLTQDKAGAATASFILTQKPEEASVYNVVYPGSTQQGKIEFPALQQYVEGSVSRGAIPLAGQTAKLEDGVTLRTPAAFILLPLKGTATLKEMEISSSGGEKISGPFRLETDKDGAWNGSITAESGASEAFRYSFGEGLILSSSARSVLFTLPGGNYSKGFQAVIRAADGTMMTLKFHPSGIKLAAATLYRFDATGYEAGKVITVGEGGGGDDPKETAGTGNMDAEETEMTAILKAGSFNIYSPAARKSLMDNNPTVSPQRSWANSYRSVGAMIEWLDCDVMGLQEVDWIAYGLGKDYDGNTHNLKDILPGYQWIIYNLKTTQYDEQGIVTYDDIGTTDAIIYKPTTLTLIQSGRYWITGTKFEPPVRGVNFDGPGSNRSSTWAEFRHNASGKTFYFFSTHLDVPGKGTTESPNEAQIINAQEMVGWLAPLVAPEGSPSIIVGDMNCDGSAEAYRVLCSNRWDDVYDRMNAEGTLEYIDVQNKGTMNANKNETGGTGTWRPDHILTDGFYPSYYKVAREMFPTEDGTLHYPSDHFPLKVILHFEGE